MAQVAAADGGKRSSSGSILYIIFIAFNIIYIYIHITIYDYMPKYCIYIIIYIYI